MSDSVLPHRRQPTRLPHPWDSPGKNTGVGCHFLFQCMKVKSESEVAQSCPTLSYPMDCSLPGSSIYGIFQARVLEWGAIAFSENAIYWGLKQQIFLFFTVLESGMSEIRCRFSVCYESLSWYAHSYFLMLGEREKERPLVSSSFIKALIPTCSLHTHDLILT